MNTDNHNKSLSLNLNLQSISNKSIRQSQNNIQEQPLQSIRTTNNSVDFHLNLNLNSDRDLTSQSLVSSRTKRKLILPKIIPSDKEIMNPTVKSHLFRMESTSIMSNFKLNRKLLVENQENVNMNSVNMNSVYNNNYFIDDRDRINLKEFKFTMVYDNPDRFNYIKTVLTDKDSKENKEYRKDHHCNASNKNSIFLDYKIKKREGGFNENQRKTRKNHIKEVKSIGSYRQSPIKEIKFEYSEKEKVNISSIYNINDNKKESFLKKEIEEKKIFNDTLYKYIKL